MNACECPRHWDDNANPNQFGGWVIEEDNPECGKHHPGKKRKKKNEKVIEEA